MLKSLAKNIIIQAPASVVYGTGMPKIARKWLQRTDEKLHYQALALSDSFSTDEWEDIQLRKLKNILVHAGDNVPFWKKIFEEAGFDPKRFKKFDDLEKLPIISRADLKNSNPTDLFAFNIPKNRRVRAATSGSTSEPFSFFNDRRDVFRRKINVFLELRHIDIPINSKALILGLGGLKGLHHYPLRADPYELELREWRLKTFYPLLTSARPEILFSTPSYIKRFAYLCRQDGFKYSFQAIRFYGESMEIAERKELEDFFGCNIYSTYGSHECSIIGIECKNRNMHTVPWLNYVEVVDEKGKILPRGQVGNIVVTFFENECMPFIRYLLGDRGSLFKKKSSCGRSSALLRFEGRSQGFLEFNDGSVYYVSYILAYLAENFWNSIRQFQLEQSGFENIIFRYVSKREDERKSIENRLDQYFNYFIRNKAEIKYEAVDYIMPDNRGKTKIFIKRI